jgi:hypothetical protein
MTDTKRNQKITKLNLEIFSFCCFVNISKILTSIISVFRLPTLPKFALKIKRFYRDGGTP